MQWPGLLSAPHSEMTGMTGSLMIGIELEAMKPEPVASHHAAQASLKRLHLTNAFWWWRMMQNTWMASAPRSPVFHAGSGGIEEKCMCPRTRHARAMPITCPRPKTEVRHPKPPVPCANIPKNPKWACLRRTELPIFRCLPGHAAQRCVA